MEEHKVLDRGYVRLVESWGSDESIICAARMSTQKGFLGWGPKCSACGFNGDLVDHEVGCSRADEGFDKPGDEKLLKYLWDHQHSSPFEFAGLVIEVKAPIMVFREWMRSRTLSYNEMSARYVPLPDENYTPSIERLMASTAKTENRQAQGIGVELDEYHAREWLTRLDEAYRHAESVYKYGLHVGVPKELARLSVPVARYSCMRASANLRNWLAFLKLRCDRAAQFEIREYSNVVASLVKERFPRTYAVSADSLGLP